MIRLFTILLLCFLQLSLTAQEAPLGLPASPGESLILSTDGSIYGVGEQIHYTASYKGPEGVSWSTVLYVELISWDGEKRGQSKVLIEEKTAEGQLSIQKNIPSGVYYLRAYTKWMRNYGPASFAYLPIKIFNPYIQEKLAAPSSGKEHVSFPEYTNGPVSKEVVFSGLKAQYESREYVEFEISMPIDFLQGSYSLSIAKTDGRTSFNFPVNQILEARSSSGEVDFLPEINGLTLSGSVVDAVTGEPVPDARMQLSSYIDPLFYAEVRTGINGKFLYSLPYLGGNPEFQLAEVKDSVANHKILLATDFCSKPVSLPFIPLHVDKNEKEVVREILVNTQLNERYRDQTVLEDEDETTGMAFYGSEASVTYVRDYIELSTLKEFIFEIIPQVSIRNTGDGDKLIIQGPYCMEIYPPLVLMDNVPVANGSELLNIPGNRIERIEVLNQAYMVGDFRYSGILSVFSRKKDMAGLEQEGERNFFNYRLLDEAAGSSRIDETLVDSTIPDIRNSLYWDPKIEFSQTGLARVSFFTSDASGEYAITLHGTKQGERSGVFTKAAFSVKK